MFSPLFRTETNHQAARMKPRANKRVGFVTLQDRAKKTIMECRQ